MNFEISCRLKKAFLVLGCFASSVFVANAQYSVRGLVVDSETNEPLPFVSILSECGTENAMSDVAGVYSVNLGDKNECTFTFVCVGFESLTKTFTLSHTENIIDVYLNPISEELEEVTIEKTKFTRPENTVTTSISTLNTKQLELKNNVTLDKALESVPGLVIVDSEPQMRGGSGFSSGMGSRVMVMLDDMPMLRADAGRPAWNFIPMEDVEQIDIHKGAASVLYGSSALNGAINVHTAYPREKPVTKINVHAGIYNKPGTALVTASQLGSKGSLILNDAVHTDRTSWNRKVAPIEFGMSAFHARKSGNWDLVFGAEFVNDPGYIGPELPIKATENKKKIARGKYEMRGRINAAARYNFKRVKGLSLSMSGNAMYSDNGQAFFWMNGNQDMYRTYPGSLTYYDDVMAYFDPVLKYVSTTAGLHTFRNRVFYSNNMAESPSNPIDQTTRSVMVYDEYQYKQTYQKLGRLTLTAGIVSQYVYANGNVFTGNVENVGKTGTSSQTSENFSVYAELEKELWNKVTAQAGVRYELYKINNITEHKPIFRAGLNYHPIQGTNIRLSWGQGYRPPTIGERYITTRVGDYGFYPNPNLKSETSWNLELGIKQFYQFGKFQGFVDIAGYYQKYHNYCEINLDNWASSTNNDISTFGFMFVNTGDATVPGVDISWTGQHKVGKNFEYMFMLSYNYCLPKTDNQDETYYQFVNPKDGMVRRELNYRNTSSDDSTGLLKYRIQHLAKFDFDMKCWKRWDIGITMKYYSQMKNIDTYFYQYDISNPAWGEEGNRFLASIYSMNENGGLPFDGCINERVLNRYGVLLFDARVGYNFGVFKVALVGTNLLNKIYTMRPMAVEQPRKVTLQFSVRL